MNRQGASQASAPPQASVATAARALHPLILTAAQMRAADQAATERSGLPSLILMENAGRGLAELVLREARTPSPLRVRIVCGAGANGGDGFVAARHLALHGADVAVFLTMPRDRIAGDAAAALRALTAVPAVTVNEAVDAADVGVWRQRLAGADVVIDAVFGIGLRDAVRGIPALAIAAMNEAPGLKVAADIPSGIEADSGHVLGTPFRADVTATMGARKLGPSIDVETPAGRVEVIDLGVALAPPPELAPYCHWLEAAPIARVLPHRKPSGHKGTFGHLLVVAGSAGKTGAAVLTGRAALRGGAGLATLASTASGQQALDTKVVELMTARYSAGDDADRDSGAAIAVLAARARAVAIGPGIPTGAAMRAAVHHVVGGLAAPMVVDADALNLLARDLPAIVRAAPGPRVLTPHPGEMASILGITTAEVQVSRLDSARRLAADANAVVVLKGARTLIATPDGTVFVNPTANPALATAGSGDVLTGIIGALLAQGLEAVDAATAGVFIHGRVGDEAVAQKGGGIVAGDLADLIGPVMAKLRG